MLTGSPRELYKEAKKAGQGMEWAGLGYNIFIQRLARLVQTSSFIEKIHTLKFGVQTGSVRKAVGSASKDIACRPFAMGSSLLPPQWLGWWLGPRLYVDGERGRGA